MDRDSEFETSLKVAVFSLVLGPTPLDFFGRAARGGDSFPDGRLDGECAVPRTQSPTGKEKLPRGTIRETRAHVISSSRLSSIAAMRC